MTTVSSLRRTPSAPAVVGYVCAAAGQSPVPQINTLMRAGVAEEDIYIVRTNGHKTAWPERDLLLPRSRSGGTITITRLDRLFYSVQNLIIVGTELRDRSIRLHAVEQNIDSNSLEGRGFFGMMSVFATLHHEFVLAATNDGLAAARARGKTGGRKLKLTQDQVDELLQLHSTGASVQQLASTFKVSRGTIYRHISLASEEASSQTR
ncbi:recombinase family protein [Streptomyces sp. NPDC002133]|uniref:recombinase family protein n=1 Tax=Streptomyces sp. NPDC002133 TaxID=3154409 RepID=UPI003334705E